MAEPDRLDELLARSLQRSIDTVPDDGFSARVVRRVRLRKSLRVLSLSLATLAGLLIALMPAGRALEKLDAELARILERLETSQSASVGPILEALRVRETLGYLSEQIMSLFALPGDAAWLAENQALVMASVLALAATAVLRLLAS